MATASPLKEYFQGRSSRTNYSGRKLRCPRLVQCQYQYQICSFIRICDLWGLTCSPSTPMSLKFPLLCGTKILYQVYLLSSTFFTYIFGQVVVTTALCIFSAVITAATYWRSQVLLCIFFIR